MENPNFKQSIKAFLTTTDFTLTKNGMDLLNRIMQYLNSKLVNYCLDNTKDGKMNVTAARDAVDAIFMGNLKHCAFAEANRVLLLYSNGMMEYKPEKIVKRKKGKKALAIAALEFSRGIFDLTSLLFPEASLQEEAKKILCQMLEEMAVKISDFVQSNGKNSITQDDIRAAAERILPQQLFTHALAEGARMTVLFETGMLQEPIRKRSDEEVRMKRVYKRAAAVSKKKPPSVRKRKRSPSEEIRPKTKRRRMPSARRAPGKKVVRKSRKDTRKISRKRKTPSISRRAPSRKRRVSSETVSRKVARRKISRKIRAPRKVSRKRKTPSISRRAPSRKRRVSSETVSQRAARRKISRKRRAPRKVSRRRTTRRVSERAPSRKRGVSKKSTTRKRPIRISPKTAREVSRKDTAKVEVFSEKISSSAITEFSRGTKKLNELYRQRISVPGMRLISECLCNLLVYLIAEMRKGKYSVIGPQEVRRTTMKVFPDRLAGFAVANMNRIIMSG